MVVLPVAYRVSVLCWFALEIALLVRDVIRGQARPHRDRTRYAVSLTLGCAIALAWVLPGWLPSLNMPLRSAFAVVGLVVVWTGLTLRIWSVVALGGSFSTFVHVDADQPVVRRGPYRRVRHPSYTGLLLIALGFGIGAGNWLSLLVCAVLPFLGLLPRIEGEEAELVRVLGDPYREYQATTDRLLPRIW